MPIFHTKEDKEKWVAKCRETRLKNKQNKGTIILVNGMQATLDELDVMSLRIRDMKADLLKAMQQFKDANYAKTVTSA